MKSNMTRFLLKATFKTALSLACLITYITASGNDANNPSSVAVKGKVPVNYYETFMITLAVAYGVYLIVRAKRRKRNSKITQ